MSNLKPITVWIHASGPNPWKVIIVLNELSLPYTIKVIDPAAIKQKPYTDLNPNGRLPTIQDPNTGITLWESGAIISYLIDTYDKDHLISYPDSPQKWHLQQWLAYQISGQGPYFGQAAWFQYFHPEKLESAIERYQNEIVRVHGVLDSALQGKEWLVGDKCTYADLAFVTWSQIGTQIDGGKGQGKHPNFEAWFKRLTERESVVKAFADQEEAKKGKWAVDIEKEGIEI